MPPSSQFRRSHRLRRWISRADLAGGSQGASTQAQRRLWRAMAMQGGRSLCREIPGFAKDAESSLTRASQAFYLTASTPCAAPRRDPGLPLKASPRSCLDDAGHPVYLPEVGPRTRRWPPITMTCLCRERPHGDLIGAHHAVSLLYQHDGSIRAESRLSPVGPARGRPARAFDAPATCSATLFCSGTDRRPRPASALAPKPSEGTILRALARGRARGRRLLVRVARCRALRARCAREGGSARRDRWCRLFEGFATLVTMRWIARRQDRGPA